MTAARHPSSSIARAGAPCPISGVVARPDPPVARARRVFAADATDAFPMPAPPAAERGGDARRGVFRSPRRSRIMPALLAD